MTLARIARNSFLAASCLVLSACMHVPVTTLYKLWSFDMTAADPGILRVATRVPSYLSARPNGIKLTFSTWRDREKDKHVHTFILMEVKETAELARLAHYKRSGDAVFAYRLNATDVLELRRLQAGNRDPAQSIKGQAHGEIGISADACHTGALPAGPILTSTYLLVNVADGYLPVLEDLDLRTEIGEKDLALKVPACVSN